MQAYGDPLQQALLRLQALEQDNTSLRNRLMAASEENFNLQATMVTCEAEAKFVADQEVNALKSSLTFKDKELSDLEKECKRLLKEVSSFRQAQLGLSDKQPDVPSEDIKPLPAKVSPLAEGATALMGPIPPHDPEPTQRLRLLVLLAEASELHHKVIFQYLSSHQASALDVSATAAGTATPRTTQTVGLPSLPSTAFTTQTAHLFNHKITAVLQQSTSQLVGMGDDLAQAMAGVAAGISALTSQITGGLGWDSRVLVAPTVHLCGLAFEAAEQHEQLFPLFLAALQLLAAPVCELWVQELEWRECDWSDGAEAQKNLCAAFSTQPDGSSAFAFPETRRSAVRNAIKIPACFKWPANEGSPVPSSPGELVASMRELMDLLVGLRPFFFTTHVAHANSTFVDRQRVLAVSSLVVGLLNRLLLRGSPAASHRPCLLKCAGALLGGRDIDSRPGVLWEMLMNPLMQVEHKSVLVASARAIVCGSNRGVCDFVASFFFCTPEDRRSERRRKRPPGIERAPSALHFLVQELHASCFAHPITLRATCVEHRQRMSADLQYAAELVGFLVGFVRTGGECALAAMAGLDPTDSAQALRTPRQHDLTTKDPMDVDDDDGPRLRRKAKRVSRISDDDSSETEVTHAKPGEQPFKLQQIVTNPRVVDSVDVTLVNALCVTWANSWRELDQLPAFAMDQPAADIRLRVVLARLLTSLVNDLVAGLNVVSNAFCKLVLRDCLSHVDAFMCRHCTNTLNSALQLTKAHTCHLESLAE